MNGKQYNNACLAASAGVEVACDRQCPCDTVPAVPGCVTTEEINPVCGLSGHTFDNESHARCQDVEIKCSGECPCPGHPNDG